MQIGAKNWAEMMQIGTEHRRIDAKLELKIYENNAEIKFLHL